MDFKVPGVCGKKGACLFVLSPLTVASTFLRRIDATLVGFTGRLLVPVDGNTFVLHLSLRRTTTVNV